MIDFIKRFFKRMGKDSLSSAENYESNSQFHELANKLVKAVGNTRDDEYACDEVLELIDQYAEMAARGEDAAQIMPLIKHHLDMCIDCGEEYEALMRVLNSMPV